MRGASEERETGGGENWETWKTWEIGRLGKEARGERLGARGMAVEGRSDWNLLTTRYALLVTFTASEGQSEGVTQPAESTLSRGGKGGASGLEGGWVLACVPDSGYLDLTICLIHPIDDDKPRRVDDAAVVGAIPEKSASVRQVGQRECIIE